MSKKSAAGVDLRVDHDEKFMQVNLLALDKLVNQVIKGKISGKEAMLFLWVASHCWKTNGGNPKNPFSIPIAQIAFKFGVSRVTVERWMKKLSYEKLLEPIYRVADSETGYKTTFKKHRDALFYRSSIHGSFATNNYLLKEKGFIVNLVPKRKLFKKPTV